jgi:hypothetical protein
MVVTPAEIPEMNPDNRPAVAIPGVVEYQLPPAGEPLNVVLLPSQISKIPVIPEGAEFTVTNTAA